MLPTLNHSTYNLKIPSTGQEIRYRPFLVKEEKTLMMAAESKDSEVISNAVCDIIKACTLEENLNPKDLAGFDLEYIFLKIRGKSIGESVTFNIKCPECKKYTPITVNFDEVTVNAENCELKKKVMLTKDVGVELKPISFRAAAKLESTKKEDLFIETIKSCISTVFDTENVYDIKDIKDEELTEWISNLAQNQLKEIESFVLQLPKLSHTVKYKCVHCGHKGSFTLEGLEDFFG